ncbi:hypothetical protein OB905_06220 [Halobacteria archaeon AArc-dxtr1]|nr:hypothetical protein [Halobacteria archaeon AArc-dxtr1]
MPTPTQLRESTQIVLPRERIRGIEAQLHEEATVSVFEERDGYCRLVGSPVEIKAASEFLAKNGIPLQ